MMLDPIKCTACGRTVPADSWLTHARTHNPSAYTEGWPCECRHDAHCTRHTDRVYPDDYPSVTR